jgi:hypothetical protein
MTFRFTAESRARLLAASEHESRSQANFLERLLEEYCSRAGISVKSGSHRSRDKET